MGKVLRKFILAFLAVVCLACAGLAAACAEKEYYTLTFVADEGITVECEAKSGAQIKEGYEVTFTVSVNEDAFGEPEVTVNGNNLKADANGVYSFKMESDTTVEITGVSLLGNYKLNFGIEVEREVEGPFGNPVTVTQLAKSEWVRFKDVEGNPLEEITVSSGETIKFTIDISIYYDGFEYSVAAGSSILRPDGNGVYTYTVNEDQNIAVQGLPDGDEILTNTFTMREDGGSGKSGDPYRIRTPLDLYVFSRLLSSHSSMVTGYFVLENDIDLKGERLYVIGEMLDDNSSSFFGGTFDGAGHTISNYYITDNYVSYETDEGTEVYLQYVGLFGFVQPALVDGRPQTVGIHNLNLDNFTVTVNGAKSGGTVFAGGLVGYGVGVNISNCSVSGTVVADGDLHYFGYAGGIIGMQTSWVTSDNTRIYSVIQSCSSNVTVRGESGYINSAGGIAGYQWTNEERTSAAILNCYSTGNVSGALHVGGITGYLTAFGSIKNCYSTGNMTARSTVAMSDANSYHLAYAGGIAGYAQYGSVISESFATGTTNARATRNEYAFTGGIVAGRDADGAEHIQTDGAAVYKCYSAQDKIQITDAFIKQSLGWADADWVFKGNGKPEINRENTTKTFTVTVKVGTSSKASLTVTDMYVPLAYWYLQAEAEEGENKLPEFVGAGLRTYGYYFDEECTLKAPYGYIPTDDMTLYAKFADYNEVTGEYYIENGDGKMFELTEDGYVMYRDGAISCVSTYVYNGEYLILNNTFFAVIADEENDFYTFKAVINNGVMEIYAYEIYTESNPLKADKKLDGFVYGAYFDANGTQYIFNEDRTGLWNNDRITYTVSGNAITVWRSGTNYTGTIADGEVVTLDGRDVTRYDVYRGAWENSANSQSKYEFDGKGGWTDGNANGTYEYVGDGSISFTDGGKSVTAVYDAESGFITVNGETYCRENSFTGTWVYSIQQPVTITLKGISADGYGKAVIDYGKEFGSYDVDYQAAENGGKTYILIYNYYELYAVLSFDSANKTLVGEVYSVSTQSMQKGARFCIYDEFKGVWSGESESGKTLSVTFNGLGNYNLSGSAGSFAVRGKITINDEDYIGVYLENGELNGSFTIGGKTYEISYDEESGQITVVCDGESFKLTKNN